MTGDKMTVVACAFGAAACFMVGLIVARSSIPPAPVCYISADDVKTPQQVVDDTPPAPPLRLGGVK